ncbi:hypothetical protein HRS9139_00862 [Pyrenophora teres f. teres]|uniref:DnaJ n=1 Tax=Pyrenophora teres f. teres TaxID=97479 RepID=A0A6S6VUJ1_9PLEO|nr:hypothetical protein HRS9139_00862 [Pyrenophora teres f. teres]KAE8868360.1 hypothetical protein PTNB29_02271 [Pyrenophora teres f. teres]CAE7023044.1 DnaJ [Pyrenophora teres f. teres]
MADINKDLQDLAKSTTEDFYELLGVPFDANEAAIKKAYRKASIRYHPDKNPDNKDAADRFIYLGWARDILVDETLKGEYDRARTRRREKALHDDLLDSRHRKMKEDLERREYEAKGPLHHIQSLKRKRPEDLTEAERREIELPDLVKRLAADGKRRRLELGERMAKERRELYEKASSIATPKTPEPVTELSRTIKLAFTRSPSTLAWDKSTIETMFSKYGKIEHIMALKEKKIHPSGEKHKKLMGRFFVVYDKLYDAYEAVSKAKADFPELDDVKWATGEPDCLKAPAPGGYMPASAPSTASSTFVYTTSSKMSGPSFGAPGGVGSHGTPKFSFSPKTPPSIEVTRTRLRQAGRKRQEEEIRKQEAAEDQEEEEEKKKKRLEAAEEQAAV